MNRIVQKTMRKAMQKITPQLVSSGSGVSERDFIVVCLW
jgi:hypothetical protein